jgi:hypothetical protein
MRAEGCPPPVVPGTLRLTRALARARSGPGVQDGRVRLAGDLATPPSVDFPPSIDVRVQDGGTLDRSHTFTSCTQGPRIRCADTTPDGRFKATFKPSRAASSTVRFRVSYLRQAIDGPFTPPLKMTLVHDGSVVRMGELASCTQTRARLTCRQR